MTTHTRTLSQIFISKLGGNVDHNIISCICELIDNSLDENASKIKAFAENVNGEFYLQFCDNGNGIKNLKNLFCALEGKKNKLGCKNQGFLDSLIYLCNLQGKHEIITKYNNNYSKADIDFGPFYDAYIYQKQNSRVINFIELQEILDENIEYILKNKNAEQLIDEEDKFFINEHGTILKIQISEEIFNEINKINPEVFQLKYNSFDGVNLKFNGKEKTLSQDINICMTNNYEPAKYQLKMSQHINKSQFFEITNNFGREPEHYKKKSKMFKINKKTYDDSFDDDTFSIKDKIVAEIIFTSITDKEAEEQKEIMSLSSIEDVRGLYIQLKGKVLGPFKYPKSIEGIHLRNNANIRICLKIKDESLIDNIIMSNKSKTNIDNIDKSFINFIKYAKSDFNVGGHGAFDNITDFKSHLEERYKQTSQPSPLPQPLGGSGDSKVSGSSKATGGQGSTKATGGQGSSKATGGQGRTQAPEDTDRLIPWNCTAYFGAKNCNKKGIEIHNGMIDLHYGYTEDDPKHRDSGEGLGTKWRRLITVNLNDEGSKKNNGKIVVEWKIKQAIENLNLDKSQLKWTTNEYFSCSPNVYYLIFKTVREVMFNYESLTL